MRSAILAGTAALALSACAIIPMTPDGEAPAETVPTTSTIPPGNWRCPNVVAAAMAAGGWTLADMPTLDRVAYGESRCNPTVVNSTGHWGALQISWRTWRRALCADPFIAPLMRGCDPYALLDVDVNVRAAYLVLKVQGWRAWSAY